MEILEGDELYRILLQRYSKNPRGWSFTVSQSPNNGFFDALVGGPDESWQLKLDTIFKPSPFVLGARTDPDPSKTPHSPISYGFRKVDPVEASTLLDGSAQGLGRLLSFLSSASPVAPREGTSYLQGPVVFAGPGHAVHPGGREQERIDGRLSSEMLRLVRRKYPSYG
jgi:hypothetical protein